MNRLLSGCDRIVVTRRYPFDPRDKKRNEILADIRDVAAIASTQDAFLLGSNAESPSWMSPVDFYVAFLKEKTLLGSVGIVLGGLLRSEDWLCDCEPRYRQLLQCWLESCGIEI
ncbi:MULTISPECIES: hypothetical protein [Stenotrophomonas]|uniref:hypothetical protein n=1 Tax=Stenotrophomonas TaxID=40323 RepID=UPI0012E3B521|nr:MULTISPECIES: hypothetical protein [Stenotrophomonas]